MDTYELPLRNRITIEGRVPVTHAEWRKTHRAFKAILSHGKYMMGPLESGRSTNYPVVIVIEDQILPMSQRYASDSIRFRITN